MCSMVRTAELGGERGKKPTRPSDMGNQVGERRGRREGRGGAHPTRPSNMGNHVGRGEGGGGKARERGGGGSGSPPRAVGGGRIRTVSDLHGLGLPIALGTVHVIVTVRWTSRIVSV